MVAVMLLAGCLSYSNSAMNPVLYAFLSENFKKSFLKACTCATGRDANAALHVENSAFPRRRTLGGSARAPTHAQKATAHAQRRQTVDFGENHRRRALRNEGDFGGIGGAVGGGSSSAGVSGVSSGASRSFMENNSQASQATATTAIGPNSVSVCEASSVAAPPASSVVLGGSAKAQTTASTTINGSLAPPPQML